MKKVSIIGSVGLPANYGGFETFVDHLTQRLDKNEYQVTVFCSAKRYKIRPKFYQGVRLRYLPLDANGAQSIPYDVLSLVAALWISDVILVLGVSGAALLPLLRVFTNKILIVHVDGMEWRRAKWNWVIEAFLKFSERMACRFADSVIADNAVIQSYLLKEYKIGAYMIAYGGDHVLTTGLDYGRFGVAGVESKDYFFTVCRIEPENNLHIILAAMAKQHVHYVVVGNWKSSAYGIHLRESYGQYAHIHLLDPVYDSLHLDTLRSNAKAYIHGHSAGGTNPSLVEAMSHGLAILAYDVGYNRATMGGGGLYFFDSESLALCLSRLDEQTLLRMEDESRLVAKAHYRWASIVGQYQRLFTKT